MGPKIRRKEEGNRMLTLSNAELFHMLHKVKNSNGSVVFQNIAKQAPPIDGLVTA
jgi:hypothetical protein